ncbi:MAG: DUF4234 domain-containing protein [Solirubrobacterales bacterium]
MEVALDAQGSTAKIRNPVLVAVFSLITLGIYTLYWWYQINREMVDYGRAQQVQGLGDNAWMSFLALFPGGLILVPPIVSLYNGVGRMQRSQEVGLGTKTLSGWVVLGVIVGGFIIPFLGLVAYGYMQAEMNKVWENIQRGGGQIGAGTYQSGDPYSTEAYHPPAGQEQAPPPPPPPPTA